VRFTREFFEQHKSDDLPVFCATVVGEIAEGKPEGQVASSTATAPDEGALR
jgi:hypothetical protein